jgi:glycosyltransferase involved in cell wall biosynthesis
MDIFAQPSVLDEGLPTSILEAQAMGLPVVASDAGGTSEAIGPGETGLLVRPKHAAALAETLGSLLDDPERRARMGSGARRLIETRFSIDQMLDHLCRTYREAVEVYQRAS